MMRQIRVSTLVLLAITGLTSGLRAESIDYPLIAPDVAQRYGLERAWFTQVPLAAGSEGIVGLRLHVSSVKAQTIFRIVTDQDRTISISERNLDAFGKPLGVDGAGKAAAEKVRLLRLEGTEGKIEQAVVPDITMYVTNSAGMIQAIDAEAGRTLWTTGVGSMRYPTTELAVTETHLAAVNGQVLYILDSKEGKILEQRRIVGGPVAGPAICGNIAYVPLHDGRLNAFTFGEGATPWPITYRSHARVYFPPTTAGDSVVWANSVGDISVITTRKRGINFRLRLTDAIAGPILYNPPEQILGVTETGYVYSFNVRNGQLMWRYVSGESSDEPPAMVGDTVFLITRENGMHAISAATGERKWLYPNALVQQFVAATAKRVYCTLTTGYLAELDIQTGELVGQIPLNRNDHVFANNQTDRMYIATRSGAIQCLHEIGNDLPVIHLTDAQKEAASALPKTQEDQEKSKAEPVDPFSKGTPDAGVSEPGTDPTEEIPPADDTETGGDEGKNPFGDG